MRTKKGRVNGTHFYIWKYGDAGWGKKKKMDLKKCSLDYISASTKIFSVLISTHISCVDRCQHSSYLYRKMWVC